MKRVTVTVDGQPFDLTVDEPSDIEKMTLLAKAPDDLENISGSDDLSYEVIDWLIEVTASQTQLSKSEIESLKLEASMRISSEVVSAVFEDDGMDDVPVPTDDWMVIT